MACAFPNCNRVISHRESGLCKAHRKQQRKGTPLKPLGWRRGANEAVRDGDRCWLILTDIQGSEVARTCIDGTDLAEASGHRWSLRDKSSTYVVSNTAPEKYLHRFLAKPGAGLEVDHWDGNRLNNCRTNLKVVCPQMNRQNIKKGERRGVYSCQRADGTRRWWGQVNSGGKTYYTVSFEDAEGAQEAVKKLRAALLGHVNEDRH